MFTTLKRDVQVIFERDPAAKSFLEVLINYPGLHAQWFYRVSHWFYKREWFVLARFISQVGRFFTQIEIHPGAEIGKGLFIDHGAGVVIGETAEIGDNVTIYQNVTLGGTGKEKGKRHPTVGNNVVISTGSKVLGSFTVGDNVRIGANSVVLKEVPPNCTVVGVPGRIVTRDGVNLNKQSNEIDLQHNNLPDPILEMLVSMQQQIKGLEEKVSVLEGNYENRK